MRLRYLWIEDYKNLKNFYVDFEKNDGLSVFVGTNGSGKSSILEAISMIFSSAYKKSQVNPFGKDCRYICCFDNNKQFLYILGKDCKNKTIKYDESILPEEQQRFVICSEFDEWARMVDELYLEKPIKLPTVKEMTTVPLVKAGVDDLPSTLLAIYSGEDTVLWNSVYEGHYKDYIRKQRSGESGVAMKMKYLNKYYWDIAFFLLWYSNMPDNLKYLEKHLGAVNVEKVSFRINYANLESIGNPLVSAFINRLFPEQQNVMELSDSIIKQRICDNRRFLTDDFSALKTGGVLQMEFNEGLYTTEKQLFEIFLQLCLPKRKKVIEDMNIVFSEGYGTKTLSEGEKKLILLKCALSIGADENSILLLDEPDAHLHESKKREMVDLFSEYSEYGRQIIMTSHSPTVVKCANSHNIYYLESQGNQAKIIDDSKVNAINKLTDGLWSDDAQNLLFNSNKPLVVLEGQTDILYIKRALNLLQANNEKYKKIQVDMLSSGGTGNMKEFIINLQGIVNTAKKIVVFCDNDDAGQKAQKAITALMYPSVICEVLPYKEGVETGEFLIEDYFDWDICTKPIIEDICSKACHPIKSIPGISKRIKESFKKKYSDYSVDAYVGFKVLLDRIEELTKN